MSALLRYLQLVSLNQGLSFLIHIFSHKRSFLIPQFISTLMFGFYLLLCKYNVTTCEGLVLHVFLYLKKANILNWAKPRPHSLGHAPHAIQTHIKCMFGKFDSNNVSKEIQQHVLRSISMDSCRVTKERKKTTSLFFGTFHQITSSFKYIKLIFLLQKNTTKLKIL